MTLPMRIFVAVSAFLAASACAGGPPPPGHSGPQGRQGQTRPDLQRQIEIPPVALVFVSMDINGDHVVSQIELQEGISREWKALDQDASGRVPALAIPEWAERAMGDRSALPNPVAFDTNLDGTITEKEFRTRLLETFRDMDRDGDTLLSRTECFAPASNLQSEPFNGPPDGGRRQPPPRDGNRR